MKLRLLNTSIVVAARDHNPTILHPAFLEAQGIVTSVNLSEPPICTPAIAVVKYINGLVFTTERNKFQVTDNKLRKDFTTSEIPNLAIKYIQSLPHVRYVGVGINIVSFIECPDPETDLINR